MFATKYFENILLNAARGQSFSAPTTLFVGLYLSNPGESGTEGTEVSYPGYQRQEVQFSAPAEMNGSIGVQNLEQITFPTPSTAVGNVTHLGILDSQTGGNMLVYGQFADVLAIGAQEAPVIVAGEAQWWWLQSSDLSNAYKTIALNILRGTSMTGFQPYLALYSGNPETGGAELAGEGYARIPIPFTAPGVLPSGQAFVENSTLLATARAPVSWGNFSFFAVMDAQSAGRPWFYRERAPREVNWGVTVLVRPGELRMTVN